MAVDVQVGDDVVDISLSGADALWALRRRLVVPVAEIVAVRVVPVAEAARHRGWRFGGTYWPGAVAAGNYTVPDDPGARAFWSVYRDDEVLEIETSNPRPRWIVLQHPDRHDLAWFIGERIPAR